MNTLKLHFCKTTQSSKIIVSNSNNCFCVSTCNYLRVLLSSWLTVLLKWTISECETSPSVCYRICSQTSKKQTWYSGLMRSPHSAQNLHKSFQVQGSFSVFKQAESPLLRFSSWTSPSRERWGQAECSLGSVTHLTPRQHTSQPGHSQSWCPSRGSGHKVELRPAVLQVRLQIQIHMCCWRFRVLWATPPPGRNQWEPTQQTSCERGLKETTEGQHPVRVQRCLS